MCITTHFASTSEINKSTISIKFFFKNEDYNLLPEKKRENYSSYILWNIIQYLNNFYIIFIILYKRKSSKEKQNYVCNTILTGT